MKLSGKTRGREGDVCCRLGWWRRGFLCCPLQLKRTGMPADVTHKGGEEGRGRHSCQVPGHWNSRAAEPAPRQASRGRPAAGMRSPRVRARPKEREVLGAHSLTRLGYSFSTQSPHMATPLTGKVLQYFREGETSRELKDCRMRPKYSPLEYLVWEQSRSPRPLATVVRARRGRVSYAATGRTSETVGERAPSGGEREGILDWAKF